jgi:DNA-binding protein HU-beta
MNKSELIDEMARCTGFTKGDAKKAVDAFVEVTTSALKKDQSVSIPGYASFKMVHRPAMDRRNVRTGEIIKAPAKNVVKIKAGKTLMDAMN